MEASKNMSKRVIALVDMDCFYVQVEQRRDPSLIGKPCAVVQYQKWKGGGIIAVGYEARACGVTRNMRGDEAREKCKDIQLIHVPENRGKADISHYRSAGAEVIDVLASFCDNLERASIDEAYIDLTELVKSKTESYNLHELATRTFQSSHVAYVSSPADFNESSDFDSLASFQNWLKLLENPDNVALAVGSLIVKEIRAAVLEKTKFTCSAGVAHNKVLAKLVAGLHKPQQQTLIINEKIHELFSNTKISKVRNLGGKFGRSLRDKFNVEFMSDLFALSLEDLKTHAGDKSADWVYWLSRGVDHEPVRVRQLPKSTGCSKNFLGRSMLTTVLDVKHWIRQFAEEIMDRLKHEREENERTPRLLTAGCVFGDHQHTSRSCALSAAADIDIISNEAFRVLAPLNQSKDNTGWSPAIVNLSLSTSKFEPIANEKSQSITNLWKAKEETEKEGNSRKKRKHDECDVATADMEKDNQEAPTSTDKGEERNVDAEAGTTSASCSKSSFLGEGSSSTTNVVTLDDIVICDRCGKRILSWDVPEHDDFHFAQDLQRGQPITPATKGTNAPERKASSKKKTRTTETNSLRNYFMKGKEL